MADDTISRKAAIDVILAINDYGNSDRANALGLAEFKITTLPTAEPQWVSCTAKFFLPINGTVIVCDSDKYVTVGYLNIIGEWYDMCGNRLKNVCAWMPLPQPYKGD